MPDGSSSFRYCISSACISSAHSCCSRSESRGSREWRSNRISVSAPWQEGQLHSRPRRATAHQWVAFCVFARAREKLLGEPEPRLLRVLHSGSMEVLGKADVQLRFAI